MGYTRIARTTLWVLLVTLLGLAGLDRTSAAEPPSRDPDAADRAVHRLLLGTDPLPERLGLAATALAEGPGNDVESAVEAALVLLDEAPRTALWLLLQARDGGFLPDGLVAHAQEVVRSRLDGDAADPRLRARWAAAGYLLGLREAAVSDAMLAVWPPEAAVRAVLDREVVLPPATRVALLESPDASGLREALALLRPVLVALDQAERDDPEVSMPGLDALAALGPRAVVPLLETVRPAIAVTHPGRQARAVRGATVLGMLGDRRATPMLIAGLTSKDGWLKVASATALGDLGDPEGVWPLCYQLFYRGDVERPRDQWEYPGKQLTTVARADWPTVQYYATDTAAADALLRLGLPRATSYLIHQKLDPSRARFRIRVLQDAVDAIERAYGEAAPIDAYNVDQGVAPRTKAFVALADWWESHRPLDGFRHAPLDENDPGFRQAMRRLVAKLRGRSIMELQIAQESAGLIGPPVTPTLLETLTATDNRVLRTEIARALGFVDDPRAVPALLGLLAGDVDVERATAAESLGAYLGYAGEEGRAAKAALLAGLEDDSPSVRVASMKGLVRAAPDPEVAQAVATKGYAAFRKRFGTEDGEMLRAETVVRLVQEGPSHWPPIREGLTHEQRYIRTAWWELIRRALALRPSLYDSLAIPHSSGWRPIDETVVLEALARRRGG